MYLLLSQKLRIFAALLAMVCMTWATVTHAEDLVSARAYWEDVQANATFDEAKLEHYTSYQGILAKGYSDSVYWLRLRIEPQTSPHSSERLILRVRPSFLDRVVLYDPAEAGRTKSMETGDMTPWADVEYHSLNHGFQIQAMPEARDVYLRVSSTSTLMVHAQVLTSIEASRMDHAQELV